jgi:hypothetical protein
MAKGKRVLPYAQKARGGKKKEDKKVCLELITDKQKSFDKLQLMTAEQLAEVQQQAAQNALNLFNKLLEELARRIPEMDDEILSQSLFSVWDKVGGGKK